MNFGHFARYVLCVSLYYSGVLLLVRAAEAAPPPAGRDPGVPQLFRGPPNYLELAVPSRADGEADGVSAQAYHVLTLSQMLAAKRRPRGSAGTTAVITVDDGYADNFEPLLDAAPQAGAPSTLFVTTDCIDAGDPTAVMWIILSVHHATADRIEVPELGLGPL